MEGGRPAEEAPGGPVMIGGFDPEAPRLMMFEMSAAVGEGGGLKIKGGITSGGRFWGGGSEAGRFCWGLGLSTGWSLGSERVGGSEDAEAEPEGWPRRRRLGAMGRIQHN